MATPNAGSSVTTYPVDRPSDQRHRLSLGRYVQSSLGRCARLCLSQRSDRPHTACGSVPPAALGPPLPGWPSYSPVSRAMGAAQRSDLRADSPFICSSIVASSRRESTNAAGQPSPVADLLAPREYANLWGLASGRVSTTVVIFPAFGHLRHHGSEIMDDGRFG